MKKRKLKDLKRFIEKSLGHGPSVVAHLNYKESEIVLKLINKELERKELVGCTITENCGPQIMAIPQTTCNPVHMEVPPLFEFVAEP
ncbi:unnamed protein product, partial [marine sediment metagenome]